MSWLMISRNSRPYKAGRQLGDALSETGNILYLLDNREQYLFGLKERLDEELQKVRLFRSQRQQRRNK